MNTLEELVGKRVEVEGWHPQTGQKSTMEGEVSGVFVIVRTPYGNMKAERIDVLRVLPDPHRVDS